MYHIIFILLYEYNIKRHSFIIINETILCEPFLRYDKRVPYNEKFIYASIIPTYNKMICFEY